MLETFERLPLTLQAIQWTGHNAAEIQDDLAGASFQPVSCADPDCTCGQQDHPEITAEVRNDFTGTSQGLETGWWVCRDEQGRLFPISADILELNYRRL